jgi:hypothetical protein
MNTALGQPMPSDGGHYVVTVGTAASTWSVGSNTFTVDVQASDGTPAVLTRVVAWMPSHGHGADAPQVVSVSPGHFEVQNLGLTMSGEWLISLKLSRDGAMEDDAATVWADVP